MYTSSSSGNTSNNTALIIVFIALTEKLCAKTSHLFIMTRQQCIEFFKDPKSQADVNRPYFTALRAQLWPLAFGQPGSFVQVNEQRDDYMFALCCGHTEQHIRRYIGRITSKHGEEHPDVIETTSLFLLAPNSLLPAGDIKNTSWDRLIREHDAK